MGTQDIPQNKRHPVHKAAGTPQNRNNTNLHATSTIRKDDYICKVAQNVEQATGLIESGFEYVTEMNGLGSFRKRK
jgi:hypothetical protein